MKFFERYIATDSDRLFLVALLGALAYINTFDSPFIFDDYVYVVENPIIKDGAFFLNPFGIDRESLPGNVRIHFLTRYIGYLSFYLNFKAHGLLPAGFHAVNFFIHMANSFIVYFFVTSLFKSPLLACGGLSDKAAGIALFSASVFAAHPLATESVTYISQRFTSLAALFYMCSCISYVHFRLNAGHGRGIWFYTLSLISALLASFTKEISVTLPASILLIEFVFFSGPKIMRALYALPVMLSVSAVPILLIDFDKPLAEAFAKASATTVSYTRHEYLATQAKVLITYLRLIIWPAGQNLDYDYPAYASFFSTEILLSIAALLLLASASAYMLILSRRGRPELGLIGFGILWFFMTISLESGLVVLGDLIFEHRTYLPSAGLFVSAGTALFIATDRISYRYRPKALILILAAIPVMLGIVTFNRNMVWADELSLWSDVASKSPNKPRGHNELGVAYKNIGRPDLAVKEYETAIRLNPFQVHFYNNMGVALNIQGKHEEALKYLKIGLKVAPDTPAIHYNMGETYEKLGEMNLAIEAYRKASFLDPTDADAYIKMAAIYIESGRMAVAEGVIDSALALDPENKEALKLKSRMEDTLKGPKPLSR